MAVACPKTVKTHNLPRLIWAAKSSRGANFFHPSHFARYTSFTSSQQRKNGRCLAKNSQNTHFPRLICAAKNSCGANFFHPSHFARYTFFTASQPRKNGRCLAKNSQNTQFATFNLGCKNFSWRELFSSQPFLTLHVFYGVLNYAKLDVAWPKTVKTHNLPRLIWAAKSSRGANFFHSSHFARYTSFTAS